MAEQCNLIHERIDDIPLLIGLMQHLHLPEIIDKHIGNHGHHKGLSNGCLTIVWLAYILSEGDHRKYSVNDWAVKHQNTLQHLLGQPICEIEFNDDRLGILLRRLSDTKAWESIENDLWQSTVTVYEIEMTGVRLDSTTTYGYHNGYHNGYHTPTEDGLMQHGYSKDHRPDLPQLKLMAAAAEPSGHLIASDVLAGHKADDPLYQPMLARVRQIVGKSGLLYAGDSKMASLETRADIVAHNDYYLTPLPLTGETKEYKEAWVSFAVDGQQDGQQQSLDSIQLIWDEGRMLGGGYEFKRHQFAEVAGQPVEWVERVQVMRSLSLAQQQQKQLESQLSNAEEALLSLTPELGRGKRQYREESLFQKAISEVLERYKVKGLLNVTWQRQEESIIRYVGRGRGSADRPQRTELRVRYVVIGVHRDEEALQRYRDRLGWSVHVTTVPEERMSLTEAVKHYRGGWSLERVSIW